MISQLLAQTVRHHQHLEHEGCFPRQPEPVFAQQGRQFGEHRHDRDLRERPSGVAVHEPPQGRLQSAIAAVRLRPAHADQGRGQPGGVLFHDCQQHPDQLIAGGVADVAHHAEVDDAEASVCFYEKVAGMRVGMEETVLEHHLQQDAAGLPGQRPGVDPRLAQRGGVIDFDATDTLQCQDPGCGGLPEDLRNVDPDVAREVRGEAFRVPPVWPARP